MFINDLPAPHRPGISLTVPGWSQFTLYIMDPLADDDRDLINLLVQYHHLHGLAAFRIRNRNYFVLHCFQYPMTSD
jgi:hypothetical protein